MRSLEYPDCYDAQRLDKVTCYLLNRHRDTIDQGDILHACNDALNDLLTKYETGKASPYTYYSERAKWKIMRIYNNRSLMKNTGTEIPVDAGELEIKDESIKGYGFDFDEVLSAAPLTDKERQIVCLYLIDNKTLGEIGEQLEYSHEGIRRLYQKALVKILVYLEK